MKNFWIIFGIFLTLIGIVFIVLLLNLRNGDSVVYTDETPLLGPGFARSDPYTGSKEPSVILIHYGSFSSEDSSVVASSVSSIAQEFPEDILVIWKDFPNPSLDPESMNAAIAARCAQRQNAFWQFHDYLMSNQTQLGEELYKEIAHDLNLSESRFNRCIKKEKSRNLVEDSLAEAVDLGLTTAPTLYINNETITGKIREADLRVRINNIVEQ